MDEKQFLKVFKKTLVCLVGALILCRLTNGAFAVLLALIGVLCVFSNKIGVSLCCYVFMPLIIVVNPLLLPTTSMLGYAARFGPLMIGLCLALTSSQRAGRHRLPFGMMIPFLMAAVISSVDGWFPKISFLKIINFAVFLVGLWIGTQNLHHRPKDVILLRAFFLAVAVFVILGSTLLFPFPSYSRLSAMQLAIRTGDMALAAELAQSSEGASALFCGVLNQSQALAPILSCCVGWIACDMIFIGRRFDRLHLILLACSVPIVYLTRSRCGLLSFTTAVLMVVFYGMRLVNMPVRLKHRIRSGVILGVIFLVVISVVSEIYSGTMSRWIRKQDDSYGDSRTFTQALTASRKGLIAESMKDFKRNPLFGMGFQVDENVKRRFGKRRGLIISASIEKGVLPTMILGETGLLGFILFLAFLTTFYSVCMRKKLVTTAVLFTTFISTNMGESTFFSPGGIGGIMWMISCVGGFTIDTILLYRRNLEHRMMTMGNAMNEPRQIVWGPYPRHPGIY